MAVPREQSAPLPVTSSVVTAPGTPVRAACVMEMNNAFSNGDPGMSDAHSNRRSAERVEGESTARSKCLGNANNNRHEA